MPGIDSQALVFSALRSSDFRSALCTSPLPLLLLQEHSLNPELKNNKESSHGLCLSVEQSVVEEMDRNKITLGRLQQEQIYNSDTGWRNEILSIHAVLFVLKILFLPRRLRDLFVQLCW